MPWDTTDAPMEQSRLEQLVKNLERAPWKFFMYNETQITLHEQQGFPLKRIWPRYHYEVEYDLQVLQAFVNAGHLRTDDPYTADIYFIPTPVGKYITHSNLDGFGAMAALFEHPIFKRVHGNRHLLVSTAFVTFRSETAGSIRPWSYLYPQLKNVTVASSQDAAMNLEACLSFATSFLDRYEFYQGENCIRQDKFGSKSVDRYASIGLADVNLPMITPTMTKFQTAQHFLFYRTRHEDSFHNSTLYRKFPLRYAADFPTSILDYDAPSASQWLDEYTRSQFCLVIRGDSPNSHALLRSIRVGCIPVIISDTYAIYNPPLPSLLELDDFAILIPEQAFLKNPREELQALSQLSNATIAAKIQGLQIAQRLLFPDHPQSLLVPALIQQVLAANEPDHLQKRLEQAQALLVRNRIPIV